MYPDEERDRYRATPERFSDMKDSNWIDFCSQEDIDTALGLGWLTEDDVRGHGPFIGFDPPDPEEELWGLSAEVTPEAFDLEAKRVEKWVDDFPWKEAWCRHFEDMSRMVFRLDGTGSVNELFDPDDWTEAYPLSVDQLLESIGAVLDARGVSHYADEVFKAAYGGIQGASIQAQRALRRRG